MAWVAGAPNTSCSEGSDGSMCFLATMWGLATTCADTSTLTPRPITRPWRTLRAGGGPTPGSSTSICSSIRLPTRNRSFLGPCHRREQSYDDRGRRLRGASGWNALAVDGHQRPLKARPTSWKEPVCSKAFAPWLGRTWNPAPLSSRRSVGWRPITAEQAEALEISRGVDIGERLLVEATRPTGFIDQLHRCRLEQCPHRPRAATNQVRRGDEILWRPARAEGLWPSIDDRYDRTVPRPARKDLKDLGGDEGQVAREHQRRGTAPGPSQGFGAGGERRQGPGTQWRFLDRPKAGDPRTDLDHLGCDLLQDGGDARCATDPIDQQCCLVEAHATARAPSEEDSRDGSIGPVGIVHHFSMAALGPPRSRRAGDRRKQRNAEQINLAVCRKTDSADR